MTRNCSPFSLLLNELPATWRLALPLIFTQLLNFSLPFIDTVMAGHHSDLTLASVSLATSIFGLIFLFTAGCALAITSAVSQAHGRDDRASIRKSFQQGLWLMIFLGFIAFAMTLGAAFIPQIIGSNEAIAVRARAYLLTLASGVTFLVFGFAGRCFVEGMAYPRIVIIVQLLMIPLNIVGNYVFLYGFWLIPPLGAQGMAISTAAGFTIYTILIFITIYRSPRFKMYRLFAHLAPPDWKIIQEYFFHGLPIALALIMEGGLFSTVGLIISRTNAVNTAANQIALNYASLSFMIPLGLAGALTVRCGNAFGRSDFSMLRARAMGGLLSAAFVMFFLASLAIIFRRDIPLIYNDNMEVINLASSILFLVGLFQIGDGMQVCASGILRGIYDTRAPMWYALLGYWIIGFPCGLLFCYGFGWDIEGLWVGMMVGLSSTAFLGVRRVLFKTRHQLSSPYQN